jgi:hypothetical protein
MVSDTGDGTVLYGNQLAILLSFLDEIPQLRKLSKELLPLGFRQLIKAACLQGNSAAVSISINLLAPNNDQATPSVVPANSGHSSPGQGNVSGEVEDLPGQQLRRRKRRRGSCSRGARPYAPAAEAWRRRRNPSIRGGGTLEEVVAELGAANLDSLTHNPRDWANIIATSGTCPTSSHAGGSFREMLEQCMRQGHDDVALSFQTMIAQIKLAVNIQW